MCYTHVSPLANRNTSRFTASFQRKVLQPITLSNGQVIPAGVMIEVAAKSIMCDPDVFHNPETFDGLRFYKSRQQPAADHGDRLESSSHRNQFVSVSSDSLAFGYGRHACPGRFFAANEIKMILAHIIVAYDIRMEESETKRYSNIQFANFVSKYLMPDRIYKLNHVTMLTNLRIVLP